MLRDGGSRDFYDAEVDLTERATQEVASALRREMVLAEIAHKDDIDGPGLLLLDKALDQIRATFAAQR